jgi:hypothetical protein
MAEYLIPITHSAVPFTSKKEPNKKPNRDNYDTIRPVKAAGGALNFRMGHIFLQIPVQIAGATFYLSAAL